LGILISSIICTCPNQHNLCDYTKRKHVTVTNLHHHWFQRQQPALNTLVHYGAAQ
jgi:hypothetical protein